MTVDTVHDKFVSHLEEMYYVENQLLDVLDLLASDVVNDDLIRTVVPIFGSANEQWWVPV